MRSNSRTSVVAITCAISIVFCFWIPDNTKGPFGRGTERRPRQTKNKTQQEASKDDRIEAKYESGRYVGDKYYRGGKLVKETSTRYHGSSETVESETITEYDPDSNGQYKTREEETTYRRHGSKRSNTVSEYGGVNNVQKSRAKTFLEDGSVLEEAKSYESGGSAYDAERRLKSEDRIRTDKYGRTLQIEHYEFSESGAGPKRLTAGYTQYFEFSDKDATIPSKKKEEHYEEDRNGRGEWKPGLPPERKSASKPTKAAPSQPKTPQPKPSPKKTLKSETTTRIIGIVRPSNSKPGEQAVVSVVLNPDHYEAIPGLKVLKKEIPIPSEMATSGSLAGILVETGDGRAQRADEPFELFIPEHASLISVTLKSANDSSLIARLDMPVETFAPCEDGFDPKSEPALTPGEEKVRRSREETYRRALRKATESAQAVDEARKEKVSEDDLAKLRRQEQKDKDAAEDAAKNVPPERRRAIQKEESDAYKRSAEEAKRKAQQEREKIAPERQKEKDETLTPTERKEAKVRADEADRKAKALDEEAKRSQEKAEALDREAKDRTTQSAVPVSYRMFPIARDVGVHVINGPFKGDAIKNNVTIDGLPGSAIVIAKSSCSLYFRLKDGIPPGMHRVTLREENGDVTLPLCVLNLTMSADQLQLLRGQSTSFRAVISGPETLPSSAWRQASVATELVDPVSLQKLVPAFTAPGAGEKGSILFVIENQSRDTVTLGQEIVLIRLNEQDFRNGPYRYEGRITARKSGSFKIDGTVVPLLVPVTVGSNNR